MVTVHSAAAFVLVREQWVILWYFLTVNSVYAVLLISSTLEMRKHVLTTRSQTLWRVLRSPVAPTISLLAPAYNEAATVRTSVKGLLSLHYPNLEVVVVNDGSTDSTLEMLIHEFDLSPIHTMYWKRVQSQPVRGLYRSNRYPNLIVVDKENGRSKADASNAGLNVASGELVCVLDADTLIEPDALQRMVRPFLMSKDVLAVGGTLRLVNGSIVRAGCVSECRVPRQFVPGVQVVEYLRAFLFGRLGWNRLGGNLIISGGFGLFRRDAVIATGGYDPKSVAEDMEMVMRLRTHGYETGGPHGVHFIPDPVAWTEAPGTLRILRSQRERWHRGLCDVVWSYRRVLFNPRYGIVGLFVFPYYFFAELLSPIIEAFGLLSIAVGLPLGLININFAILFFVLSYGYSLILTMTTLVLDEINYHRYEGIRNRVLLLAWAALENIGYHQITIFWRLQGIAKYALGHSGWGVMERQGFVKAPDTPAA